MLIHTLKTLALMAVTAPPFLLLLIGCRFDPPGEATDAAVFANIEAGRTCAITTADIEMGIDLAKQDEQGFWVNASSKYGLDYSPAARAACNGMPQKVMFLGEFPAGMPLCIKPHDVGPGKVYATVTAAVQGECSKIPNLIDVDGNPFRCDFVAWPAHRADMVFPDACNGPGMPKPNFQDPRKLPPYKPVAWTTLVNVQKQPDNSLVKQSATPDYDAGASGSTLLNVTVNSAFEFTAIENNRERIAGFRRGPDADNDPSDGDIAFGVVLQNNGTFLIRENGQTQASGPYAANDQFRLVVMSGQVAYFQNGVLRFTGAPVNESVLRISVSLKDPGATIAGAQSTF